MKTKLIKPKKIIKVFIISASEHDWFFNIIGQEVMVVEDGEHFEISSLQKKLLGYEPTEVLLIPKIYADVVENKLFRKVVKSYPKSVGEEYKIM